MGSKQLPVGKLSDFIKYGKIPSLLGPEDVDGIEGDLEVFEKIDGGNCQVRNVRDWNLFRGSRAHFIKGKNYSGYREWFNRLTTWVYSNPSLYNLPDNLVLFGEWSGNHRIEYDSGNVDKFFDIDLYDLDEERFVEYERGRDLLDKLRVNGVRFLDVLARGRVGSEEVERLLEEPSSYRDGPKEGLVIKDYKNQRFYKIYHPDSADKVRGENGNVDHLTDARFMKVFFGLLESGEEPSLDSLCNAVIRDIRTEDSIVYSVVEARGVLDRAFSQERLRRIDEYF